LSQRRTTIILVAVLVALVATIAGWYVGRKPKPETPREIEMPEEPVVEGTGDMVDLFFPGDGLQLYAEAREVPAGGELEQRLVRLLQEFAAGPESIDLFPVLTEEISVGWTHVNSANIAYVDLVHTGEASRLPWGSGYEMLSIYSIVNTILLNMPEISAVILLSNGQQRETLAGHIDTSRPLVVNRELIASIEP